MIELAACARRQAEAWPRPIIELLIGERSAEAVRAAAKRPDEVCEASFHLGDWHLLRGEKDAGFAELKAAAERCDKGFVEYTAALADL